MSSPRTLRAPSPPPTLRVSRKPSPARGPRSPSGLRRWKDRDAGEGRVKRGRPRRELAAGSGERSASSAGRVGPGAAAGAAPWTPGLCRAERAGSRGAREDGPGRSLLLVPLAIVPERRDSSLPGFGQDEPGSAAGCESPRRGLPWAPRRPGGRQPRRGGAGSQRNDSTLPHRTANAFREKTEFQGNSSFQFFRGQFATVCLYSVVCIKVKISIKNRAYLGLAS